MTGDEESVAGLIARLHEELSATAELPLEAAANRWLGEAEAVVADLDRGDPDRETVARRVRTVRDLLEEVDGTGREEGDARVARARELAAAVSARVDG